MTTEAINQLIDNYLEGKTSPEEERQLAVEVNRPDAPEEWKVIAEMLGELTLGEALYGQTMAERKRKSVRRHYIGWSVAAVAACLTLWFVLGKLVSETPQQEHTHQIVQQPVQVVKPKVPEEKEEPAVQIPVSPVVEQVAYTPPVKRMKRKHHRHTTPIVGEAETALTEETLFADVLPEVSKEELEKVERDYQMWQLKQTVLMEQLKQDAATAALNNKYEEYLAESRNNIEI